MPFLLALMALGLQILACMRDEKDEERPKSVIHAGVFFENHTLRKSLQHASSSMAARKWKFRSGHQRTKPSPIIKRIKQMYNWNNRNGHHWTRHLETVVDLPRRETLGGDPLKHSVIFTTRLEFSFDEAKAAELGEETAEFLGSDDVSLGVVAIKRTKSNDTYNFEASWPTPPHQIQLFCKSRSAMQVEALFRPNLEKLPLEDKLIVHSSSNLSKRPEFETMQSLSIARAKKSREHVEVTRSGLGSILIRDFMSSRKSKTVKHRKVPKITIRDPSWKPGEMAERQAFLFRLQEPGVRDCFPGGYPSFTAVHGTNDFSFRACRPSDEVKECLFAKASQQAAVGEYVQRKMLQITYSSFGAIFLFGRCTATYCDGLEKHLDIGNDNSDRLLVLPPLNGQLEDNASIVVELSLVAYSNNLLLKMTLLPFVIFSFALFLTCLLERHLGYFQWHAESFQSIWAFCKYQVSLANIARKVFSYDFITLIFGAAIIPLAERSGSQTYHRMKEDGIRDLCRFNEACYVPSEWTNLPVNTLYSNVAYIVVGTLFYLRVLYIEYVLGPKVFSLRDFGEFNAIATCFVFEGIMSTIYHMCPSRKLFQFDAMFMYLIPTLGVIAMSQPISATRTSVDGEANDLCERSEKITLVIGTSENQVSAYSYYFFFVIPMMFFNLVAAELESQKMNMERYGISRSKTYYFQCKAFALAFLIPWLWSMVAGLQQLIHGVPLQLFSPTGANSLYRWIERVALWAFATYMVVQANDCSHVFIMMNGLAMVWGTLCAMWRRGSRFLYGAHGFMVACHGVLTLLTLGVAGYTFLIPVTDKNLSPAQSRHLAGVHGSCVLWGQADYHDVWHIASAIGLGLWGLFVIDMCVLWNDPLIQ